MKLIIYAFLFSQLVFAYKTSESFLVTVNQDYVEVVSPVKKRSVFAINVKNKTLLSLRAKLMTKDNNIHFFTVKPNEEYSFEVNSDPEEKLMIVPLAPAFQAVELKFSSKPYAIPPQT